MTDFEFNRVFYLGNATEYTDPISIQFFFAPPREPAESNTNVTRIYNSILVQRHEWFFFIIITICRVHKCAQRSEIRVRSTTLAGNTRVTSTMHDDVIIKTTDNFFLQTRRVE